jgi:hypothetical protein
MAETMDCIAAVVPADAPGVVVIASGNRKGIHYAIIVDIVTDRPF